jgi:hypothetical protein
MSEGISPRSTRCPAFKACPPALSRGAQLTAPPDNSICTQPPRSNSGSYTASSDRRHVFGLGTAGRIEKLTVVWPDGKEQQFAKLELDHYYRLTEENEKAEPLYGKD